MPGFSLEVRGVNRAANPIRRTIADFPQIADRVMQEWAKAQRVKLKAFPYPAKRPGQTYVRTGNLANRWSAKRVSVARWSLVNSADYAEYVIGDAKGGGQAWMHSGRWWTAAAVIGEGVPELTRDLTRAYAVRLKP